MVSDDIVMYLVIVEGEIIKVYFFFDIFLLGSYIKKNIIYMFILYRCIYLKRKKKRLFIFVCSIDREKW